MALVVVDPEILRTEAQAVYELGGELGVRSMLQARDLLLLEWAGLIAVRFSSEFFYLPSEGGVLMDGSALSFPTLGAMWLPDSSHRSSFESAVERFYYSKLWEFKRVDTGVVGAAPQSSSWHLSEFAAVGAGAGIRLGIADSGLDTSRASVTLEQFRSFNYASGAANGSSPEDYSSTWHGSQVASFACGHNEGVVPGASCCVAAVLTENDGRNGSVAQIASGLDWLGRQGVDVVNCSFGSDEFDPAWYKMILNLRALGVVVVAGIGNESSTPLFPGCFHNVVAVGASDVTGAEADWSARGPAIDGSGHPLPQTKPDLVLPGVELDGEVRGEPVSGTSYASPLAAGALATRVSGVSDLPVHSWDLVEALKTALAGEDEDESEDVPSEDAPSDGAGESEEDEETSSTTDSDEREDEMAKVASSIEVNPNINGFKIEDPDGDLVGLHLGGFLYNT